MLFLGTPRSNNIYIYIYLSSVVLRLEDSVLGILDSSASSRSKIFRIFSFTIYKSRFEVSKEESPESLNPRVFDSKY